MRRTSLTSSPLNASVGTFVVKRLSEVESPMTPSGTPLVLAEPVPLGSPPAAGAVAAMPVPIPVTGAAGVVGGGGAGAGVDAPVMPVAGVAAAASAAAWVAAKLRKRAGSMRLIEPPTSFPKRL